MSQTYTYPQAQPMPSAPPLSWYGRPSLQQSSLSPTPLMPPPSPVAPSPIPTSPTVCLQMAEDIAPRLSHPSVGLLHYVAFVMLTTNNAPYHPDSSHATQALGGLIQQQLVLPQDGGYVLSNLGHAVMAHIEANAIR